jgi:hypothetical protein
MDLLRPADGADLDARDDRDAPSLRFGLRRRDPVGGIVVGDGQDVDALARRPLDDLLWG